LLGDRDGDREGTNDGDLDGALLGILDGARVGTKDGEGVGGVVIGVGSGVADRASRSNELIVNEWTGSLPPT